VFDRVATALADLPRVYDGRTPTASPVEEAIAGGGLVLTGEPAAYWGGARLDIDWARNRTAWRLLSLLAEAARAGHFLAQEDAYDRVISEATYSNAISRLRSLLPTELQSLIRPGPQPRTYRLDARRNRVHVFATTPLSTD
jgi:hypothetical protein